MIIALGAAAALFLVVCPLPMRVSGDATVTSAHMARVQSALDGVVKNVYVREGSYVKQGAVLASLEDWNYRAEAAAAQAKFDEAAASMNHALSVNDGTQAGTERVKADYWRAELTRSREQKPIEAPLKNGWQQWQQAAPSALINETCASRRAAEKGGAMLQVPGWHLGLRGEVLGRDALPMLVPAWQDYPWAGVMDPWEGDRIHNGNPSPHRLEAPGMPGPRRSSPGSSPRARQARSLCPTAARLPADDSLPKH